MRSWLLAGAALVVGFAGGWGIALLMTFADNIAHI